MQALSPAQHEAPARPMEGAVRAHAMLRLPAELTIFTASQTRSAWLDWLADDELPGSTQALCVVDAQEVAEVDAAGVQLLLSLANTLARQQRRLQLQCPSPVLRQACLSLGVHELLLPGNALDPEAA